MFWRTKVLPSLRPRSLGRWIGALRPEFSPGGLNGAFTAANRSFVLNPGVVKSDAQAVRFTHQVEAEAICGVANMVTARKNLSSSLLSLFQVHAPWRLDRVRVIRKQPCGNSSKSAMLQVTA